MEVRVITTVCWVLSHEPVQWLGIKLENIVLSPKPRADELQSFLQEADTPTTVKVKKQSTVRSQPLPHDLIWEGKKDNMISRHIYLVGYGHGETAFFPLEFRSLRRKEQLKSPLLSPTKIMTTALRRVSCIAHSALQRPTSGC